MFLGQFALGVDHLRLDPAAEFQPFAVCVRSDVVDAFGEDDDAVTLCDLLRERGSEAFVPVRGVVEMCIRDRVVMTFSLA